MKTTIKTHLFLSAALALGLAASAAAQDAMSAPSTALSPTSNYGLLGTTYAGAEFGYTHRVEAGPSVLHRYGFIYNAPLPEGVDFNFNYDYLSGRSAGVSAHQQGLGLGFTGYRPQSWGKPFLQANAGWIFRRSAGEASDSFAYTLKTGVEFQLLPALVVTPYVSYSGARHFSSYEWNYGAKGTYRFTKQWSGAVGVQIDERHNLEFTLGVNFHY